MEEEIIIVEERKEINIPLDKLDTAKRETRLAYFLSNFLPSQVLLDFTVRGFSDELVNESLRASELLALKEPLLDSSPAVAISALFPYNAFIPIINDNQIVFDVSAESESTTLLPMQSSIQAIIKTHEPILPYEPDYESDSSINILAPISRTCIRFKTGEPRLVLKNEKIAVIGFIVNWTLMGKESKLLRELPSKYYNLQQLAIPSAGPTVTCFGRSDDIPLFPKGSAAKILFTNYAGPKKSLEVLFSLLFNLNWEITEFEKREYQPIINFNPEEKPSTILLSKKEIELRDLYMPRELVQTALFETYMGIYTNWDTPSDSLMGRYNWASNDSVGGLLYAAFEKLYAEQALLPDQFFSKPINYLGENILSLITRNETTLRLRTTANNARANYWRQKVSTDRIEWAIFKLYGLGFLDRYRKVAIEKRLPINLVLPNEVLEKVNGYIDLLLQREKNWTKSVAQCPHHKLRKEYDAATSETRKAQIIQSLREQFAADKKLDEVSQQVYCKLCGFRIYCGHEWLLAEIQYKKSMESKLEAKLQQDFYPSDAENEDKAFVNCRYCGLKIIGSVIKGFDQFDAKGNYVYTVTKESMFDRVGFVRDMIQRVLNYTEINSFIASSQIQKAITPYLTAEFDKADIKESVPEVRVVQKQMYVVAYTMARIIYLIERSDFTYDFPAKFYKNKTTGKKELKDLLLAAIKSIQSGDPNLFRDIREHDLKIALTIRNAYIDLVKDIGPPRRFSMLKLQKLYGYNWRSVDFLKEYTKKHKLPENYPTSGIPPETVFAIQLELVLKKSYQEIFDIHKSFSPEKLNHYWIDFLTIDWHRGMAKIRHHIPDLIAGFNDPVYGLRDYNYVNICAETGKKQAWDKIIITQGKNTVETTIKKLKEIFKIQMEKFQAQIPYAPETISGEKSAEIKLDFSTFDIKSASILSSNCPTGPESKEDAEIDTDNMTVEDREVLKAKAEAYEYDSMIPLFKKIYNADSPPLIDFKPKDLPTEPKPYDFKEQARPYFEKPVEFDEIRVFIDNVLSLSQKQNVFNAKKLIEDWKLTDSQKVIKLIHNLGRLTNAFADQEKKRVDNKKSELAISNDICEKLSLYAEYPTLNLPQKIEPDSYEHLKIEQNIYRLNFLQEYFNQFRMAYLMARRVNGQTGYPWIEKYIKADFAKVTNITKFSHEQNAPFIRKIVEASDINVQKKSIAINRLFFNALVEIGKQSGIAALFVLDFIREIAHVNNLLDMTQTDLFEIELEYKTIQQLKLAKFMKMSMEEKRSFGIDQMDPKERDWFFENLIRQERMHQQDIAAEGAITSINRDIGEYDPEDREGNDYIQDDEPTMAYEGKFEAPDD